MNKTRFLSPILIAVSAVLTFGLQAAILTPPAVLAASPAIIASAAAHSCGVTPGGKLYCWGGNIDGQLGDGTRTSRSLPTLVVNPSGKKWSKSIALADRSTCAIAVDGELYCWGHGEQLGVGSATDQLLPSKVTHPSGAKWSQVDASDAWVCALDNAERLYCWGLPWNGWEGGYVAVDLFPRQMEIPLGKKYVDLSVGVGACLIDSSGVLYCGGLIPGNFPTLPNGDPDVYGSMPFSSIFSQYGPPGMRWNNISTASWVWCGISQQNDLYCWGLPSGVDGVGDGDLKFKVVRVPQLVTSPAEKWQSVDERGTACAITTTGHLFCWGSNRWGELGNGSTADTGFLTAVADPPAGGWSFVELGDTRTCGVSVAGEFYCWGRDHSLEEMCPSEPSCDIEDDWGSLGNGAIYTQVHTPVRADPPQSTVDPDTLVPAAPGVAPLSVAPNRSAAPSLTSSSAARYRAITYKVPTTKFFAILKPTTPTYQWYRCPTAAPEASGSIDSLGCTLIVKATKTSYKSVAADRGSYLRVLISATNGRRAGAVTTQVFTPSTARLP